MENSISSVVIEMLSFRQKKISTFYNRTQKYTSFSSKPHSLKVSNVKYHSFYNICYYQHRNICLFIITHMNILSEYIKTTEEF